MRLSPRAALSSSLFGTLLVIGMLAAVPSASAEVRTATAGDPADATPTVSGQPSNPDVRQVTAQYDSSGTITLTIDFYNAFTGLDTSANYAFYAFFSVGSAGDPTDPNSYCSSQRTGDLNGQHHVYSASTFSFFNRAAVKGFDGYLNFDRTVSDDQRQIRISATGPAIANRDYRCLTYELYARQRASSSHPDSRYDESCDCWYLSRSLDSVGEGETSKRIWFDGFRPVAPDSDGDGLANRADQCPDESDIARPRSPRTGCPSPPPDADGDGLADSEDQCPNESDAARPRSPRTGCLEPKPVLARVASTTTLQPRGGKCKLDLTRWEVTPDRVAGKLRDYTGRLRFIVTRKGQTIRRKSIDVDSEASVVMRRLRSGTYLVTAFYTGDRYRQRSNVVTKRVRIKTC